MLLRLPDDLAGCPARQPGHFSCFAKRSNQEKATPKMAVRLRGLPTPLAPKSGSVCNSLRSNSRRFLSDFGTSDVAPSTGIHVKSNGNVKSDGNVKSSVKGSGNGNGRCAGNVKGNGRCAGNGNGGCA
jgi:hypothetical protein